MPHIIGWVQITWTLFGDVASVPHQRPRFRASSTPRPLHVVNTPSSTPQVLRVVNTLTSARCQRSDLCTSSMPRPLHNAPGCVDALGPGFLLRWCRSFFFCHNDSVRSSSPACIYKWVFLNSAVPLCWLSFPSVTCSSRAVPSHCAPSLLGLICLPLLRWWDGFWSRCPYPRAALHRL